MRITLLQEKIQHERGSLRRCIELAVVYYFHRVIWGAADLARKHPVELSGCSGNRFCVASVPK